MAATQAINLDDARRWMCRLLAVIVGLVGFGGIAVSLTGFSNSVFVLLITATSLVSMLSFIGFGAAWFWWRGLGPGRPGEQSESLVDWLDGVFGGPNMSFGAGVLLLHVVFSMAAAAIFAVWNTGTPMFAIGGWFITLLVAVRFWQSANQSS